MNTQQTLIIIISIIMASITSISMWGCHEKEESYRERIRAGLVQKAVPSTHTIIWTRPDGESLPQEQK